VRWGIGHSTGLLTVGLLFLVWTLDSESDTIVIPYRVSRAFELLVGVFLLVLGVYGIRRALEKHMGVYDVVSPLSVADEEEGVDPVRGQRDSVMDVDDGRCSSTVACDSTNNSTIIVPGSAVVVPTNTHASGDAGRDEVVEVVSTTATTTVTMAAGSAINATTTAAESTNNTTTTTTAESTNSTSAAVGVVVMTAVDEGAERVVIPEDSKEGEHEEGRGEVDNDDDSISVPLEAQCCVVRFWQRVIQKIPTKVMAFLAGIVHGLAGPGGVLGVIPAVQLHDARLATLYLTCFCVTSTMTMGVFAMVYGGVSSRLGTTIHHELAIELVSSSLSILVGVVWLLLSSLGKLDDVFH
jgi:hypothetical protein